MEATSGGGARRRPQPDGLRDGFGSLGAVRLRGSTWYSAQCAGGTTAGCWRRYRPPTGRSWPRRPSTARRSRDPLPRPSSAPATPQTSRVALWWVPSSGAVGERPPGPGPRDGFAVRRRRGPRPVDASIRRGATGHAVPTAADRRRGERAGRGRDRLPRPSATGRSGCTPGSPSRPISGGEYSPWVEAEPSREFGRPAGPCVSSSPDRPPTFATSPCSPRRSSRIAANSHDSLRRRSASGSRPTGPVERDRRRGCPRHRIESRHR